MLLGVLITLSKQIGNPRDICRTMGPYPAILQTNGAAAIVAAGWKGKPNVWIINHKGSTQDDNIWEVVEDGSQWREIKIEPVLLNGE